MIFHRGVLSGGSNVRVSLQQGGVLSYHDFSWVEFCPGGVLSGGSFVREELCPGGVLSDYPQALFLDSRNVRCQQRETRLLVFAQCNNVAQELFDKQ